MSSLPQESSCPEFRDLVSTLPKEEGWIESDMYKYQGFWSQASQLQGTISCHKHFDDVQDSDIFLVSIPKSGTTWLKSITFATLNRTRFDPFAHNHPLLAKNPHTIVPFLEINFHSDYRNPEIASLPRLFATHLPYVSLPEMTKSRACKIVYLCRNPKDTFVSLWHFTNKLRAPELGMLSIEKAFDMFCTGVSPYGPYWEHVLEYWRLSNENPNRVFFLKYEDLMQKPGLHLRRLAEFLGCPFSTDEEESGMVEQILKLCSFDHLRNLKVNKDGVSYNGGEFKNFFRRGVVGDWKNYFDADMADKIDQITQMKLHGSGLVLS